jgi:hypothetical protein
VELRENGSVELREGNEDAPPPPLLRPALSLTVYSPPRPRQRLDAVAPGADLEVDVEMRPGAAAVIEIDLQPGEARGQVIVDRATVNANIITLARIW